MIVYFLCLKVSIEDKKNSIETKHNVTPTESDINVLPKIKNTKKQRNANIRKPIDKHDKVRQLKNISQHKKIVSDGHEDLEQTENIEKISSGTAASKADEETKKLNKNSDVSRESKNRKSTYNNNNKHDIIPGDKSEKISINGHGKKTKKEKLSRKSSSSPKIITTKSEKDSKNRNEKQKNTNDQLVGDWQLQRFCYNQ